MLRVAVIGLGNIGKTHTRYYAQNKDVKLVGLCDMLAERVDPVAQQYGVKAYPQPPGVARLRADRRRQRGDRWG